MAFDEKGYKEALATQGLQVVEIASTPVPKTNLIDPKNLSAENPLLRDAMALYVKNYVQGEGGIPGEGEDPKVISARLNGKDPHCDGMTVLGLMKDGKVQGVSFIEHYIDPAKTGLVHLNTYSAVVDPMKDNNAVNAAFHAGVLDAAKQADDKYGLPGTGLVVAECNSFRGFSGEVLSSQMESEFVAKTGLPPHLREGYLLGGQPQIVSTTGTHATTHILSGMPYTPPNLGGEGDTLPQGITSPSELAPLLRNSHIINGDGEPLFLAVSSPYHNALSANDLERVKAFQEQLGVSVATQNLGMDAAVVREARKLEGAGFGEMDAGFDKLIGQARGIGKGGTPDGNPEKRNRAESGTPFQDRVRDSRASKGTRGIPTP